MILQALKEYYDRKAVDPTSGIAPEGYEWKTIPYVVLFDGDGHLVDIQSTEEEHNGRKQAKQFLVPQGEKKSSAIKANPLWDNTEYTLGITLRDDSGVQVTPEKAQERHHVFLVRSAAILDSVSDNPTVGAFLKFLTTVSIADLSALPCYKELERGRPNVVFRRAGSVGILTDDPIVASAVSRHLAGVTAETGLCLVTGTTAEIARLHPSIKGVTGGHTTGGDIVSFNLRSFESYGKSQEQGLNAPISQTAAFAYTTALNHLLRRDSRQRLTVGDTTAVFWAARDDAIAERICDIFGDPPKDDPDRGARAVADLYRAVETGAYIGEEGDAPLFCLGLAPNAKRLSIRFWHCDTVRVMVGRIKQHFDDLRLDTGPRPYPTPSLQRLLLTTAAQHKYENIPPNLGGNFVHAVLNGLPYPETLLPAALRRAHAEQSGERTNMPHERAALIKACINRKSRLTQGKEELTMSLDPTNANVGYRLGRLFAVLERLQSEANPGINATIRDRYYGAASGTPVSVFPILMRLKNHHLAKLENVGRRVNMEKLIGEIVDGVTDFPTNLSMADQGRFAIGYYHQQQAFFVKKQPNQEQE
jgi:CRISPR-associated protein Csd1